MPAPAETVDPGETVREPQAAQPDADPVENATPEVDHDDVCNVMLECPMRKIDGGYAGQRSLRMLSHADAATLREYVNGLQREGAMLADGRIVESSDDGLRYFLEQLRAGQRAASHLAAAAV
jgi:hypothetical protein